MKRGKFIVFEGIDGCGKTTQIQMLKERFKKQGLSDMFYFTKEPTDGETGKYIRKLLSTDNENPATNAELATAFLTDRLYHNLNPVDGIRKYIDSGINVICDRYLYSNMAYQGVGGYYDWVKNMNINCPDILQPDIVIMLNIKPSDALQRIYMRSENTPEIFDDIDKLKAINDNYSNITLELMEKAENSTDESPFYIAMIPAGFTPDKVQEFVYSVIMDCLFD